MKPIRGITKNKGKKKTYTDKGKKSKGGLKIIESNNILSLMLLHK